MRYRIPMQAIAGIQLPAGYPCLWYYYGTLSFYTDDDSPGSRRPDPDRAGKLADLAAIRKKTGWPVYNPSEPAPPLADWRWADTEHARGVRAGLEAEQLRAPGAKQPTKARKRKTTKRV